MVSAQLFLPEAAAPGRRDAPHGAGTAPHTAHPREQNAAPQAHRSTEVRWHLSCGDRPLPPFQLRRKPVPRYIMATQLRSRLTTCQALTVIAETEPDAGPAIKAFDLLLLKGLSQNHLQS